MFEFEFEFEYEFEFEFELECLCSVSALGAPTRDPSEGGPWVRSHPVKAVGVAPWVRTRCLTCA